MFGPKNRHGHVATGRVLGEAGGWGLTFKMLMVDICFWELKLLPLGQRRLTVFFHRDSCGSGCVPLMGRGEVHAFLVYILTLEVVETLRKRRLKPYFQVNMRLFSDENLCNSQCIEGDKKEVAAIGESPPVYSIYEIITVASLLLKLRLAWSFHAPQWLMALPSFV